MIWLELLLPEQRLVNEQRFVNVVLILYLQGCLDSIYGHDEDPPGGGGDGGHSSLGSQWHVGLLQVGEHRNISSRVSKPGQIIQNLTARAIVIKTAPSQRSLKQSWPNTTIEPPQLPLLPEGPHGLRGGAAVSVLVVHDSPHPHQAADLRKFK